MSKLIAVCGSPNSGKTTAALKLAQEIYHSKKTSVHFISPDTRVPCMGYLFPNGRDSELYSLGVALDKTDIFREDVLKQSVSVKTMQNFGFLGFKLGENRFSYPRPTEDKVVQMFKALRECVEYIICDCTCEHDDLVSNIAKRDCDIAVQMYSPDMRCLAYYASCVNQFLQIRDKRLKVLNVMDKQDEYFSSGAYEAEYGSNSSGENAENSGENDDGDGNENNDPVQQANDIINGNADYYTPGGGGNE